MLGDVHPDTFTSTSHLVGVLQSQGKLQEAQDLEREMIDRCRAVAAELTGEGSSCV